MLGGGGDGGVKLVSWYFLFIIGYSSVKNFGFKFTVLVTFLLGYPSLLLENSTSNYHVIKKSEEFF